MSVQEKAIRKALGTLDLIGADYRVEYGGYVFTPAGSSGPAAAVRRNMRSFDDTGYGAAVKAMQPGDVLEFVRGQTPSIAAKSAFISFRASVTSRARKLFGPDNIITELRGDKLALLRVQ